MRSVQTLLAAGADVNEKRRRSGHAAAGGDYQRARGSRRPAARQGRRSERRGGIDRTDGAGMRALPRPITLKTPSYREQLRDVGTEGGNGANNSCGRPLQAAVHVANWHVSDEFISSNIDRLRVIKSLIAHGAEVNGRNTDMEPRWSGARYRRRQVGADRRFWRRRDSRRRRGDAPAAAARRRSEDRTRDSTSRR